jgi:hypothetical protein
MYIELQRRNEHVMYVDGDHVIVAVRKSNLIMEATILTKEF